MRKGCCKVIGKKKLINLLLILNKMVVVRNTAFVYNINENREFSFINDESCDGSDRTVK